MSRSFTKTAAGFAKQFALRGLAAAVVLAGLTASTVRAQDNSNDVIRPLTKQGSAAMIFHLNGLGNFGLSGPTIGPGVRSVDSAGGNSMVPGIGFKYFPTDDIAIRILLAFQGVESGKVDLPSGKYQRNSTGAGFGAEYHFRPLYSTSPYIGAQIAFFTENEKLTVNTTDVYNNKVTSFGVAALAGFDWFFTRGLALGGEMKLGFTSSSIVKKNPAGGNDEPTNTDIGIGTDGNVHLLVYF
jgi:outer membrane protein W